MKWRRILGFGVLLILLLLFIKSFNEPKAPSSPKDTAANAPKEAQPLPKPAVGEQVSEAYAKQVFRDAKFDCKDRLEKAAVYGFRISATVLGMRMYELQLDRWNKYQRSDGRMTFSGEGIETQSRFGEWTIANWRCEWDVDAKRVVDASLDTGKLPKLQQ